MPNTTTEDFARKVAKAARGDFFVINPPWVKETFKKVLINKRDGLPIPGYAVPEIRAALHHAANVEARCIRQERDGQRTLQNQRIRLAR